MTATTFEATAVQAAPRRLVEDAWKTLNQRYAIGTGVLVAALGRPDGLKDGPCLARLAGMGLAAPRADGRWQITALGQARHGELVNPHRARKAGGAAAAGGAGAPAR
jgi:hypothetical protein